MTDDELKDLSQTTETQIISDLKNHLKPIFDIRVETFVDQIKQMIDNELRQYLVDIKNRRKKTYQLIENKSKQYITEYKTKIDKTFDSIHSEEELQSNHYSTLEDVLQSCGKSNHFGDKTIKSLQLKHIENQVMKIFDRFLAKFREKLGVLTQSYKAMYEQSISSYQKVFVLYNCLL